MTSKEFQLWVDKYAFELYEMTKTRNYMSRIWLHIPGDYSDVTGTEFISPLGTKIIFHEWKHKYDNKNEKGEITGFFTLDESKEEGIERLKKKYDKINNL